MPFIIIITDIIVVSSEILQHLTVLPGFLTLLPATAVAVKGPVAMVVVELVREVVPLATPGAVTVTVTPDSRAVFELGPEFAPSLFEDKGLFTGGVVDSLVGIGVPLVLAGEMASGGVVAMATLILLNC